MRMTALSSIKAVLGALGAFMTLPAGELAAQPSGNESPVVIELFTSQSCSSCVAAIDYFEDLAAQDDIVALSWHVDYWNMLNTKHGRWVDPYSDSAYTERQRYYNKAIRKRSSVYTPQIIVGGVSEGIGSSRKKISAVINNTRTQHAAVPAKAHRDGDKILFDISASENGGNAYLISFLPFTETNVQHGENAGRVMKETNVVTGVTPLGVIRRTGAQLAVTAPGADQSCAVIVQEPNQGRIISASYCP